jgi:hypothetical protein
VKPLHRRAALAASLLALAGCGSDAKLVGVAGTVTYKGEPLDSGTVTFFTTDPPAPAGGALVTNGKFKIDAERGLAPGTYRVQISSPRGVAERTPEQIAAGASAPARERIPAKYNTASQLTVEVTRSGPNEFNWAIE